MGRYNEKQRLIQKLGDINKGLEESVCRLCKTVLNKDKLKYFKVEKKLTEDKIEELTEIPEPNLEYDASIKILERVIIIEDNRKELIENENEINKIYHELATKKARLNKIDELLKDVDEDEPFRIQKDIRNMQAELTRIEIDIKTAKERLSEELSKKSEIDQKLKSINQNELNIIEKRIKTTSLLIELFESSISKFRSDKREEVEKISTEIFLKIRSKTDFKSLEINNNFGLSIITQSNEKLNKSEWRSAGEEQIVALSLIGALNKCAQINAPLFMDTPFSRLDTSHGESVLKYISSMADQVVLLVTDREFRIEDEKILQDKIVTDYTVIHRGEERGSSIIPTSNIGGSF